MPMPYGVMSRRAPGSTEKSSWVVAAFVVALICSTFLFGIWMHDSSEKNHSPTVQGGSK